MPRFNVGGALFFDCWNRSIGLLRRHRFISFVVCSCLNVFFVLDILVICGLFVDLNSANGRVHPSPSFRPSDFLLEGPPNKLDVRLLCWISSTSRDKENSIRETWGKRCDKLIFISNSQPLGTANPTEGQSEAGAGIARLFARTTLDVLKQLHDHYLNDSDWFLKADAATYVVVDQLKLMLSTHNPATPCYMAGNNRNNSEIIGDAYVLSRESIRRLVRQFRRRNPGVAPADCDNWRHSPTALKSLPTSSRCLDRLGIVSLSTQDDRGCERFLNQSLAKELILNDNEANADGSKTRRCISDRAVIFPRLGEHDFYFYEHLLYRLKMPANVMK
ncbi:glycoprotein-N-acetylgalactosamine 3-beta-galactosyltransferase 1-like [Daphnia pulicaria]|uniref:glycoprotein-N-acetylgalactosamine 3-beta-galactosyltransferase 1-like n=1 Tax=Daphnia pulicaria TaxID=35523 RepID=UPI001EEA4C7D|nr:glycoprotein-N-acetylgalactosamine 3-beta-galactosyltransferase 1-like [Daphnia pulicaria]